MNTLGGVWHSRTAWWSTLTESKRERRISSRFLGVYRQLTLRPVKFTMACAPSISRTQSPKFCPSHVTKRPPCRFATDLASES